MIILLSEKRLSMKKNITKVFAVLLAAVMLLSVAVLNACGASKGNIVIGKAEGKAGDNVSVTVSLENNPGIITMYLELTYDQSRLTLVSAEDSKLLSDSMFSGQTTTFPYNMNWDGSVSHSNITDNGTICTLNFKILDNAPTGDAFVKISYDPNNVFNYNLNNVAFDVNDGKITVTSSETGAGGTGGGNGGGGGSIGSDNKSPNTGDIDALLAVYTDITKGVWYYNDVAYVVENELFEGTSLTEFSPDVAMTRGMLVTVLYRLAGEPAAEAGRFFDVDEGTWYYNSVSWAEDYIVLGNGDGYFEPNKAVSRQEMATILMRYANLTGSRDTTARAELSSFADASSIADWATEAISWANAEELINGTSDTTLDPLSGATRAQVAAVLNRFAK
jgi:hypothetical protein